MASVGDAVGPDVGAEVNPGGTGGGRGDGGGGDGGGGDGDGGGNGDGGGGGGGCGGGMPVGELVGAGPSAVLTATPDEPMAPYEVENVGDDSKTELTELVRVSDRVVAAATLGDKTVKVTTVLPGTMFVIVTALSSTPASAATSWMNSLWNVAWAWAVRLE